MTITLEQERRFLHAVHVDLRPLGEDRCLLTTPSGELFELEASTQTMAALLTRCNGKTGMDQVTDGFERAEELKEVLETLVAEGCLLEHPPELSPLSKLDLHLIGDQDLCHEAAAYAGPLRSVTLHAANEQPQPENPAEAVVVALQPYIDGDWLIRLDQHAASLGCSWTQLHFDCGKGWLGPFVIPGRTSDYRDLVGRRRCSGDDVEGAQMRRPLLPDEGAPHPPRLPDSGARRWMLALLFAEIEQAFAGSNCRMFSAELEADGADLSVVSHHILPLPTRVPDAWLSSSTSPYQMVVDQRTGVILSQHVVDHHPTLPENLITVRSHCTDLSRIYPWGNDLFVGGSTFGDEISARGASLGEALERYCGNCLPGVKTVKASFNQLAKQNRRALDPETLVLHSEKMMAEPGCPFEPFTRDLEVHWVEGRSLTQDASCLLPLALTYANWMGGDLNQPVTNYLYTPGMAAGQNLERALVGACRELVERDITMAWWLNAAVLPAVKPTPALEALWDKNPHRDEQVVRYIHLDNPFNIPVMVAAVWNTRHQFLNIGFGCRPDPEMAARKALTEALTLQEGSRDLVEQESTLRKTSEEWGLLNVDYMPWREDRRYMDSYRADFRDVNDLMLQQQFYLDPRALEQVKPLLDPPVTRTFNQLPRLENDRLDSYRKPLEQAGFELLYADITSPDIMLTGYRVVRAMVPGLIPNMPAAFPATGGPRVFNLPVEMGWRKEPLSEDELNYFPMPHA